VESNLQLSGMLLLHLGVASVSMALNVLTTYSTHGLTVSTRLVAALLFTLAAFTHHGTEHNLLLLGPSCALLALPVLQQRGAVSLKSATAC
jgi:hypothetical protein